MPALIASAGDTPSTALVASAVEVEVKAGQTPRAIQTLAWQKEAWRHIDICGEARFAANRFGAALSRCRVYIAEVDEFGQPGKEATDKEVQGLSASIFGGPTEKVEAIRLLGTQGYVAGESYVVAEDRASGDKDKDKWYVVTTDQIQVDGSSYTIRRPQEHGGGKHTIRAKTDLMMRVWNPHPRDTDQADSPIRSVLPVLREIERLSMLTMSQIDSRLISAGLLLLPAGIEFPHEDDSPGGIVGLMEMILEAAQAQLTGAGDARGLVPIIAEVPLGAGADIQHLRFDTPVQGEIKDKLDHAIRRLALGLDADPAELLGQGDSNHWSAWAVDEGSIKLYISPALARICLAFTAGYLRGALEAMGKDPDAFVFWYDTAPLAARPDQREDAFKLYEQGLISIKALLDATNFSEDDQPNKKERLEWRLWQLIKLQPALVYDPSVQEVLGLPALQQQAAPGMGGEQGALPPGDAGAAADERGLPQQDQATSVAQEDGGAPQQGDTQEPVFGRLMPAANLLVYRALELAGGRLRPPRAERSEFSAVPRHDMHTRVIVPDEGHAETLLSGAFAHVDDTARYVGVGGDDLGRILRAYCVQLITRQHPHSPELLEATLKKWLAPR
jgi:hypothetical protein